MENADVKPAVVAIECTLKRKDGSRIDIDGTEYHFQPSEAHGGRHVCAVSNPDHIAIFLGISESYKMLGIANADEAKGVARNEKEPDGDAAIADPDPVSDQNEHHNTPTTIADLTDAELRAHFELTVGRKPNPKAKRETLIAQIEAAKADAKN